jgi:hypothetical protein
LLETAPAIGKSEDAPTQAILAFSQASHGARASAVHPVLVDLPADQPLRAIVNDLTLALHV